MPIDTANLEPLVNMLTALAQRQETLRQLAVHLHSGALWRAPDGSLAAQIPDAQKAELTAFAKAYLDESEIIIATARALLAPGGGAGG